MNFGRFSINNGVLINITLVALLILGDSLILQVAT